MKKLTGLHGRWELIQEHPAVVLEMLPADAPAIAIVQHMPPGFTAAFAKRLNSLCAVNITEELTEFRLDKK